MKPRLIPNHLNKVQKMPNLTLYDHTSQHTYILEVSNEVFTKANADPLYATRLLQEKLNTTNIVDESASTSSSINSTDYGSAEEKTQQVSLEKTNFDEKDGFRWPHEAILLLLEIYKDQENKITSGKMSVKKFWNMVTNLLLEKGYQVTGIQCKSKMAGLKNTYKSVKDHNAKSGNHPRIWQYFNIMDEIFNKKPWISPMSTLDSDKPIPPISFEEDCDIENVPGSSSTKTRLPMKRKRPTTLEKVLEENTIARKKMHEETMVRQDKLLDLLSKLLDK
ncbi:uncharacterized protein LOC118644692 isoform X2 [Monomorium pharaonis]|uniref:uncharacterized protein LOC118644692 isoform X2 n=1 Tax=Monomorium pharaonis TaxID=307658 RepID=UPI0017478A98|nr:uncharacterized protein LOC118644692 isoform X2 [Monomorium pharaonis]